MCARKRLLLVGIASFVARANPQGPTKSSLINLMAARTVPPFMDL